MRKRKSTKEVLCMSCFDRMEIRQSNWIRYDVDLEGNHFNVFILGAARRCIPCLKRSITFGEVALKNP